MARIDRLLIPLAAVAVVFLGACATENRREDVFALVHKADSAYEQGDWAEAEKGYRAITVAVPNDAYAYLRLGNTLARQKRLDEAAAAYREALVRDVRLSKAYHNIAMVRLMQAEIALEATLSYLRPHEYYAGRSRYMLSELRKITRVPPRDMQSPVGKVSVEGGLESQ